MDKKIFAFGSSRSHPGSTAIDRMCESLDIEANHKRFRSFPEAYCHTFGLTRDEIAAVTDLDVPALLELGACIECIAKLTGVFSIDVLQLWSDQTGLSVEELSNRLAGNNTLKLFS